MEELLNSLYHWLRPGSNIPHLYVQLFNSFLSILILLLIRWGILRIILGRIADARLRYNWMRFSSTLTVIVLLMVLGQIWIDRFNVLMTYFGLLSAGVAIALSDMIKNFAGWFFLILRRPFELGDRIEIGEHAGDVIDIRLFQFSMIEVGNWVKADQSTGRVIHIPNGRVFTETMSNYYSGLALVWSELEVVITFESDWQKAKVLLQSILDNEAENLSLHAQKRAKNSSQRYMIYYNKLTPIVYTSVLDSGVCLTLRHLTKPRMRRIADELIWEAVLKEFARHTDIDFAYPTSRFYNHASEGKEALK